MNPQQLTQVLRQLIDGSHVRDSQFGEVHFEVVDTTRNGDLTVEATWGDDGDQRFHLVAHSEEA